MNNSFRGGFNNFNSYFKKGFSFKTFNSSFMNSKGSLNFMRNNQGNAFRINFSNKFFMNQIISLNLNHPLVGRVSPATKTCGLLASVEDEINTDLVSGTKNQNEGIMLLGDLSMIRDDCKWTCAVRLGMGPHSPMKILEG